MATCRNYFWDIRTARRCEDDSGRLHTTNGPIRSRGAALILGRVWDWPRQVPGTPGTSQGNNTHPSIPLAHPKRPELLDKAERIDTLLFAILELNVILPVEFSENVCKVSDNI